MQIYEFFASYPARTTLLFTLKRDCLSNEKHDVNQCEKQKNYGKGLEIGTHNVPYGRNGHFFRGKKYHHAGKKRQEKSTENYIRLSLIHI